MHSTAGELLRDIRAQGITPVVEGQKLKYSPRQAMTSELLQRIRAQKAELIGLLERERLGAGHGRAERRARAEELVHRAVSKAVLMRHLPRLLDWMASGCPPLFRKQEKYGIEAGQAGDEFEGGIIEERGLQEVLDLWSLQLRDGARLFQEQGLLHIGPSPIWAFWTCYSEKAKPETGLSRFLKEEVGYPTDDQAGMSARTGGTDE